MDIELYEGDYEPGKVLVWANFGPARHPVPVQDRQPFDAKAIVSAIADALISLVNYREVESMDKGVNAMDNRKIASRLLFMAKEVLGMDFPTQKALDKYLKDHPYEHKSDHRVNRSVSWEIEDHGRGKSWKEERDLECEDCGGKGWLWEDGIRERCDSCRGTGNKSRIASALVKIAKELMGMDFPTQDAMDKYMKDHPDANRSNHKVVKTPEKKEPAKKESPKKESEKKDVSKKIPNDMMNHSVFGFHEMANLQSLRHVEDFGETMEKAGIGGKAKELYDELLKHTEKATEIQEDIDHSKSDDEEETKKLVKRQKEPLENMLKAKKDLKKYLVDTYFSGNKPAISIKDGNGKMKWSLGELRSDEGVYSGEIKDEKPNGKGSWVKHDGSNYKGNWKDGKLEGKATIEYPDNKKVDGEFKDGKLHGKGKISWGIGFEDMDGKQKARANLDGIEVDGNWEDGKMHGIVVRKFHDGRLFGVKGPVTIQEKWEHGEKKDSSFVKEEKDGKIASRLLFMAKEVLGMDFPTQDAMDKYMKDHPDADRSNHKVVKDPKDETSDEVEERLKKKMGPSYKTQEQRLEDAKPKHGPAQSPSDDMENHPYNQMRKRQNEKAMKEIGEHYKKDPKDLTVDEIVQFNQRGRK